MGIIYCITFPSAKQYVGQTRQCLKKRLIQHKSSRDATLISRAMQKYKTFDCQILIECNDNNLDEYEQFFIHEYDTISPNGYNMRSGGQNGYHFSDEVRLKCSRNARKHSQDLPMYVYETINGYRCRPPDRPEKYFNYTHIDKETNLLLAIEYLQGNNNLYNQYITPISLPKYICKVNRTTRTGYRITYPGYEKHFTSMKLSEEQKYTMAIQYFNSIMEKVQRLNGSGRDKKFVVA